MSKLNFLQSLSRRYDEFGRSITPRSKAGKQIYKFFGYFSVRERLLFYTLLLIFLISFGLLVKKVNDRVTVSMPAYGGTYREGVVGIPRFTNPVLAASEADKDVATLVYSGLMRVGPTGDIIPDLASGYTVSDDGLVYTFTLRADAKFHDGAKVTSDDVSYTIGQIKNPIFKSPRRGAWDAVTVETPEESLVVFRLQSPYALFLEGTTVGILPKHLWKNFNDDTFPYSDLNLTGIGSGPYKITSYKKDKDGVPTMISLTANADFTLGRPYIRDIELNFYSNEDALHKAYRSGAIDAVSGVAGTQVANLMSDSARVVPFYLPRIFAVFFNQNQVEAFTYTEVRQALAVALDRDSITKTVLSGYGNAIYGPIPPGSFGYSQTVATSTEVKDIMSEARSILETGGWELDNGLYSKRVGKQTINLSFSLATANIAELKQASEMIRDRWNALGANVELKVYEVGDLNQNVIRPRNFDALFFGEIVGRNPDPYFFWHSKERSDPGLNIAMYANPTADKLAELIRTTLDKVEREARLTELSRLITDDHPAAFIYAPHYIYLINNRVHGAMPTTLTSSDERFSNVHTWYIDTERVWKIFSNN